ncbi:TPA: hypothetical protein ACL3B1_001549 [Streptococcus pneumoniae]|nr:hypothetical protein [Streptococcus pneumoniae]APD22392.1 hypothetical protein IPP23_00051 [Streptococcus phage IPP23]MDG7853744.1 hypothetical protein [Streptococcus pneumoniae]MDV8537954.1 hypothetical protein [Streptococcus pneumoniae]MDV8538571.1 hypothetical protein [Streptococcus pneumoniae]MDV8613663.1 hypothetical protein [Streptococcus pneumoniae]
MGIDQYLKVIKEGVFGRDVRQAIHDGIERVYEDATFDGNTNMEVARARGGFGTLGERLENLTFADVNKNFGKIDQTMLSSELLAQIAGTAPINHNPANRSVIESMTTFFENVRSVNLFNRENVRNGYYNTSGIWTANAGFRTPINYMIVKPSAQYTFRATIDVASHFVSWFTAGGIFIKTEALSSSTETKTSPSNAERAYFTSTARGLATYTVAEGDSATTDTTFFEKWILKDSLFEIKDQSVTTDMTTFFETKESTNIFDRSNVRKGYINTSGAFTAHENYRLSDTWIPVNPNEQLTIYASNNTRSVLYSFYSNNQDNAWLSTKGLPTSSQIQTITVPVDVKFVKFTCGSSTIDTFTVARGTQSTTDTNFFRYTSIKPEYLHGLGLGQSSVIEVDKIGDIKSVRDAVSSIKEEGTVKVNSGTYIDDIDAIGKTVHLVGINKNSTIIRTENSSRETPPLEATSGSVSNMTFYASWPSGMVRPSDGRTPYAAHIDYDEEANKTLVIEDCDFTSDWNAAVGIGMRVGFNLIFRRCKLHSTADGLGGVFFHDATTDSLRGESWITFEDCEITSDGRHALSIQAQGTEADVINCKFVRCNIYSKRAGKTINWSDNANSVIGATVASHLAGDNLFGTKNFRLDQGSYGNNLEYFNA